MSNKESRPQTTQANHNDLHRFIIIHSEIRVDLRLEFISHSIFAMFANSWSPFYPPPPPQEKKKFAVQISLPKVEEFWPWGLTLFSGGYFRGTCLACLQRDIFFNGN